MNTCCLSNGTSLQNGKYRILRLLGQGGFGITYEAEQPLLRRKVAIKEFFMKDCCERDESTSRITVGTGSQRGLVEKFRGKFIREAQMIASMDHPNIVRVTDVFEENDTAYYVMENLPCGSLADKVKKEGPLTEELAGKYIRQVAGALEYIHSLNTVHLDVKPSNILLSAKGEAVLIDFGISKHYDDSGEQTSSTPVGISKGFAPLEQSRDGDVSQFKPSTDIYALGATYYYLVTGLVPPEASLLYEEGFPDMPSFISSGLKHAIEQAMSPRRKDRPQTINEFLSLLGSIRQTEETLILSLASVELKPLSDSIDKIFTISGCSFKMVYVKGGSFLMGSVNTKGAQRDECPIHKVTIDDFFIGETVVTHQLWSSIMGVSRNSLNLSASDPATNLSYDECMVFIDKLNSVLGEKFRLPTEAEWEYAAKGGEKNRGFIYSGGDDLHAVGHIGISFSSVKSKLPNDLGLYDMSANVNEWCEDWYGMYGNSDLLNPHGPLTGYYRIARGGAYNSPNNYCRVSFRNRFKPSTRKMNIGFRLAL